ncbi:hypothetical protein CSC14_2391 [Proteus mirabilis]|nr:hypothetical protein CSC14_2391 [Proteus mirabilis]
MESIAGWENLTENTLTKTCNILIYLSGIVMFCRVFSY